MGRESGASEKVRDESTWDVTHLYMEAMLETLCIVILISISTNTLFYYCLYFLFNKIRDKGRTFLPGSEEGWGEEGGDRGRGRGEKWPKHCMHI
jgi:hypothetical protein